MTLNNFDNYIVDAIWSNTQNDEVLSYLKNEIQNLILLLNLRIIL